MKNKILLIVSLVLLVVLFVGCPVGSQNEQPENTPPIAQDISHDAGGYYSTRFDMTPYISDAEDEVGSLIFEVVSDDGLRTLIDNWPELYIDSLNHTGGDGPFYITYRVKDTGGDYSETKTITLTNINN